MNLTLAEAAMAAGAVLEAPAHVPNAGAIVVRGYSIDSRTAQVGELFFAVRGERLDGHAFASAALERGAAAAVVARAQLAGMPNAVLSRPLLIVDDPLLGLQRLASYVRQRWGRTVAAVTGSAGKTSTKDAIAAALGAGMRTLKSHGNLNNHFGLPLQLLRLEPEDEFAVVEMGMNHAGEIAELARIAAPNWGVVTNVGYAHVEMFTDGQAGIARAKYELIASLPAGGVAFLNADDAYVSQFGREFDGRVVHFGAAPPADPQILRIEEKLDGVEVRFRAGECRRTMQLKLLGAHNALNAMAGVAVALEAGVDLDAAVAALEALEPGDKRGQVLHLGGVTILNDCYNSNPEALKAMIATLSARPAEGRRVLVAGEMLELGELGEQLHSECGEAAAASGLHLVVAVQGKARFLAAAAAAAGTQAIFVDDAEAAGKWMAANLQPGDVVLVKGSRGVGLERAIELARAKLTGGQVNP